MIQFSCKMLVVIFSYRFVSGAAFDYSVAEVGDSRDLAVNERCRGAGLVHRGGTSFRVEISDASGTDVCPVCICVLFFFFFYHP